MMKGYETIDSFDFDGFELGDVYPLSAFQDCKRAPAIYEGYLAILRIDGILFLRKHNYRDPPFYQRGIDYDEGKTKNKVF